jgi:virulence-associated protein VagC
MNQQQRDYLVKKIEGTFESQKEKIDNKVPEEPSLNRHFIAVFLDGSAKIFDPKKIKENLIKHVKELGSSDFVEEESDYNYKRKRGRYNETTKAFIKVDPRLIMETPKSFDEAYKIWKAKREQADKEIKDLDNQREVLILKIQLGSNAILDKLITQVDSLGDLDLFSNQLTLIAENINQKQKQLSNGTKRN